MSMHAERVKGAKGASWRPRMAWLFCLLLRLLVIDGVGQGHQVDDWIGDAARPGPGRAGPVGAWRVATPT
jgi:hypothetical protein